MEKTRGRGRPPVTTREVVEDVAMTLFEQRGIENTTVVDIAEACEMSKTSFFRYFASKNEILWGPFEAHIQRLEETLHESPADVPIMEILRDTIRMLIESELFRIDAWLRRFKFQNTEEQRSLTLMYWGQWEGVVAQFVRDRSKAPADSIVPETAAGAIRGAFRAFLRLWVLSGDTRVEELLPEFDRRLGPIFTGFEPSIERIPREA